MSVFDLSGIFSLQRNYLIDLSNAQLTGGAGANNATTLANQLNGLMSSLSASQGSANAALTDQQRVLSILQNEKARVDARKNMIDKASVTQDHINQLNDSATKRFTAYNNILIVLVITFGLFFLLSNLYSYGISSTLLDSLIVIVFAVGIVISLYYYGEILGRDNMDFDRIKNNDPPELTEEQKKARAAKAYSSGNLMGNNSDSCVGSQCCPSGTIFNTALNKCVIDIPCVSPKVKYWTGIDISCVTLPSGATYNGTTLSITCPSGSRYDYTLATCKEIGTESFTSLGGYNGVKIFEPSEFTDYAPYPKL